jgi:hypothetical protein
LRSFTARAEILRIGSFVEGTSNKVSQVLRKFGDLVMRHSTEDRYAWRLEERRKEARYTLILRAGLIEQEGKTAFCLLKNISTTGVQLKVYGKPALNKDVTLHVADEQPVTGRIAWIRGDIAGMTLKEELDAATLLRVQQKLKANKRRAVPRMSVEASALLRTGGRVFRATVRDISSLGARVTAGAKLRAGDRTIVELTDLPAIRAYVRWTDEPELGLAFETPIPMQLIAHWIEGRAGPMRQPVVVT